MVDPAGRSANSNGSGLEAAICLPFQRKGFVELGPKEKREFERSAGATSIIPFERWYAQQVKLERGIYGAYIKSDIFVRDPVHFADGLHIECKWQQTPGSVDEKYPYTMLSLLKYERPSIFVLAGSGARSTAVEWLRAQAQASKGHVKFFYGTDTVISYLNKMLTQDR